MKPEVLAIMSNQHGLITRPQAVEAGLTDAVIDRLVATGVWTSERRGVYVETALKRSLTSTRDRRLLADRAARLRIRPGHVGSHDTAAYELDLPILHARNPFTHVTRPRVVGAHIRHGVKHHLAPYDESQVVEINGGLVLGLARTAVDLAREHGRLPGLVAMDSALRLGATRDDLARVAAAMKSWPEITVVRTCIEESDPDTDSIVETLSRDLVSELGFGRPKTQFGLTDGRRTAWADLRLGRHLIECDGRIKYRPVEMGGLAEDEPEQVLDDEKDRQDWFTGFKLGMSRITMAQHFGAERQHTLDRVRREYLDTCARFGTDIDDLTPFLARGPRPRPGARRWAA